MWGASWRVGIIIFIDFTMLRIRTSHKFAYFTYVGALFDWENDATIDVEGINVILHWYSGSPANLPEYIFAGYKKKDGL